jgi:transposase
MNAQHRHDLSDEQWHRLARHLPPEKPATGRPAKPHRPIVNAILWRLRSGAPWRDIPPSYGNWQTIASRYRRWRLAGIWQRVWRQLQAEAAEQDEVDERLVILDGSHVRAHHHAAGARKKGGSATTAQEAAPSR